MTRTPPRTRRSWTRCPLACFAGLFALASSCKSGQTPPPKSEPNAEKAAAPEPAAPIEALPVEPATSPPAPQENPFLGAQFFVDPSYAAKVEAMQANHPELAAQLDRVKRQPTALWMDRIDAVSLLPGWLEAAAKQQKESGKPVVPLIVVYDLPNRDCAAKASAGELEAEADGETRYRTEFIDAIAARLAEHSELKVAAIIEPDSLPNMATNLSNPRCKRSAEVYKHSLAYAVSKLSLPNVYLYMDAAHSGWICWAGNQKPMATLFKEVLDMAGGVDRIRGFATNTSNYNALEGDWGTKLGPGNPCHNELDYVDEFSKALASAGIENKGFIVDTSRNGVAEARSSWGSWCNVRGAGLGPRPQAAPRERVDAYYWVKPPGDSDGVADPNAPRFDEMCAGPDASPGAPQAGEWFESYFVELVKNASPPL